MGKMCRKNAVGGVQAIIKNNLTKEERIVKMEALSHEPFFSLETDHPASVGTSRGRTIGLPKFNAARIDVWLTVPCDIGKIDETYEKVKQFVVDRVAAESDEIIAWVDKQTEQR